MAQRLPTVGSDDGTWGTLLNDFLNKEHYDVTPGSLHADSGQHKTVTIKAGTAAAGTAPLKFTSGTLLTAPEAGAIEYLTNRFYIRGSDGLSVAGNVAVGTAATPISDLHISNTTGTRVVISGTDNNSLSYLQFLEDSNNFGIELFYDGANNELDFRNFSDSANIMTIERAGNVGIGTTGPATKL